MIQCIFTLFSERERFFCPPSDSHVGLALWLELVNELIQGPINKKEAYMFH